MADTASIASLPRGCTEPWLTLFWLEDALYRDAKEKREHTVPTQRQHLAEFDQLPFEDNRFSAVLSNLYLHWINDLPTLLREIHRVLIPDGVLLGAMLGGDTLYELRCALQLAEQELTGGLAAHVSPMIASSDLAGLLKSAGYVVTTGIAQTLFLAHQSSY